MSRLTINIINTDYTVLEKNSLSSAPEYFHDEYETFTHSQTAHTEAVKEPLSPVSSSSSASIESSDDESISAVLKTAKPRRSVRFAPDTKEHDGRQKDAFVFEKLVTYYLSIGGMQTIDEMITYLANYDIAITDVEIINKLVTRTKELADNLKILMEYHPTSKGIPLLPEGGDIKVPPAVLPNIEHLQYVWTKLFE